MDKIIVKTRLDVGGKNDWVQEVNKFKFGKNKLLIGQDASERWDLTDDWDASLAEQYLVNLIEDVFYQYDDDIGVTRTISINSTEFTELEEAIDTIYNLFHIYLEKMNNKKTKTEIKSIEEKQEVENELDSSLPLLIDETIKGIKVEDGKLWLGFESGTVTVLSKKTLADNTDGWVY